MKLARDLKSANISIGDMHALMNMTLSEVESIKKLLVNEIQYSQIKSAEDKFLDKPILTESEGKTIQRESIKVEIDRQRREDEFLYQR